MMHDPFHLDDTDAFLPPSTAANQQASNKMAPMPYLTGLNEPQFQAVTHTQGPLLVLAGAGTGKTRVLTSRIAHILQQRLAAPWQILAVTFTNKAAKEMEERVARYSADFSNNNLSQERGLWMGTFHSVAARILRRHSELVGLTRQFTILDTDDQQRLLKQLILAANIDEKRWPARQLATLIDRWKNAALSPEQIDREDAFAFANGQSKSLYSAYQERLKALNACDFGDLLLHNIQIFQKNPDILAYYHRQFRYLLVDEYQDTNIAQYLWLRLLAQGHRNICCVGDDDQSIYGWRGAEVGNILRFESDFPGATLIRLEQNYRSTGHILAAAGALIKTNENRLGKSLWTEAGDGDPVYVRGVWDANEEARSVCDEIEARQRAGNSLSQMAILIRAGFQTREFEERLIHLGLPYRVIGGPRFYERLEIRDAIAYLRLVLHRDDDLAFERIINTPKRGLGDTSLKALHSYARAQGLSLYRAAEALTSPSHQQNDLMGESLTHAPEKDSAFKLRPQASRALGAFLKDFANWRALINEKPHNELAAQILEESGYTAHWQQDKSPEAPGRLENLKELVNALAEFENLTGFLEHIALVMDNSNDRSGEKISLMTLHGAKGLEFDTVFLPGWEEGVFPSKRSIDESGQKGLEEERRLAYVGLTRARQRAYVFFAANRQIFGQWQSSIPSRFIEELPSDHLDADSAPGLWRPQNSARLGQPYHGPNSDHNNVEASYSKPRGENYGPGWQRYEQYKEPDLPSYKGHEGYQKSAYHSPAHSRPKSRSPKPKIAFAPTQRFAIGERVFHEKFGYGQIEDIDGNRIDVHFEKSGLKRLLDRFLNRADEV